MASIPSKSKLENVISYNYLIHVAIIWFPIDIYLTLYRGKIETLLSWESLKLLAPVLLVLFVFHIGEKLLLILMGILVAYMEQWFGSKDEKKGSNFYTIEELKRFVIKTNSPYVIDLLMKHEEQFEKQQRDSLLFFKGAILLLANIWLGSSIEFLIDDESRIISFKIIGTVISMIALLYHSSLYLNSPKTEIKVGSYLEDIIERTSGLRAGVHELIEYPKLKKN